ncbi:hypothetical protein PYCC9005_003109 [Savitreella phatthalungensis]
MLSLLLQASLLLGVSRIAFAQSTNVIDLGYCQVQGSVQDSTNMTVYYNVRYAAPPVGDLRWAKPQAPLQETTINNGSIGHSCPQAFPKNQGNVPLVLESSSEDCLVMNIFVPNAVTRNASVVVWLHGGGFVSGDKQFYAGDLVQRDPVIFIAANYRLGAFGWMAGSSFASQGGTPNLGLYDQRAILDWVQQYISKFGGDPQKVTVAGQSAGAASIMHHITARGGTVKPAFQQAILESPAFQPMWQTDVMEQNYQTFLSLVGCSDLACLRSKDTDTLQAANQAQVGASKVFGSFVFGPTIDGDYVPDFPAALLTSRQAVAMPMLLSTSAYESVGFANTSVTTEQQFEDTLTGFFNGAADVVTNMVSTLYPVPPTGLYQSQYDRLRILIQDTCFVCNIRALAAFIPSMSYVWQFDIGTAGHSGELFYLFPRLASFVGASVNYTAAALMQRQFVDFALLKTPGNVPSYREANVLQYNNSQITTIQDPNKNERCSFWVSALYDASASPVTTRSAAVMTVTPRGYVLATATSSSATARQSTAAGGAASTSATASTARSGAAAVAASLTAALMAAAVVACL